jgi:multidrug efflux pump subunit AcrB
VNNFLSRFIRTVLIALAPSLFCALLTSPMLYAFPLKCPPGSRVIGIECFDANYNNTTPWYRKDMGASAASFPIWFAASLVVTWSIGASVKHINTNTPTTKKPIDTSISQTANTAKPRNTSWLPEACPHCGAALASTEVQWLSSTEAECSYCNGVIRKKQLES